jgi:uncharacterized protein (DUF1015 family)
MMFMTREEAQKEVSGNALSFMHVEKSEIDVPDQTKSDDDLIYQTAKRNFVQMQEKGILLQDESPCFYIYQQQMSGRAQTGIVGTMSAAEYDAGKIKKHELTRQDKEEDRINHVSTVNAQTGPVFISYRERKNINKIVDKIKAGTPEYDFTADDGVIHTVWIVADAKQIEEIKKNFVRSTPFILPMDITVPPPPQPLPEIDAARINPLIPQKNTNRCWQYSFLTRNLGSWITTAQSRT